MTTVTFFGFSMVLHTVTSGTASRGMDSKPRKDGPGRMFIGSKLVKYGFTVTGPRDQLCWVDEDLVPEDADIYLIFAICLLVQDLLTWFGRTYEYSRNSFILVTRARSKMQHNLCHCC